ncbi:MAG: site-specific integrase [Rhodospirillaceae bacterium]|nr:site-specific integrase [Rhodospirillaceae bacterium]
MALKDVAPEDAANLHRSLRGTPAAANQTIWVLSKMFSLAESWEMVPPGRNPCRHIRHYRATPRERFLTPEEFRRVGHALKAFEARGSMLLSAIAAIRLLMLTGCRSDEILTLQWEDIDRVARVLRLRDSKTGPRMVPLTGTVLKVLDGLEREDGVPWVLRGAKPKTRLACLSGHWRRVRKAAGLDDVRLHDCRHSYASRALALGEGLPVIGRPARPCPGRHTPTWCATPRRRRPQEPAARSISPRPGGRRGRSGWRWAGMACSMPTRRAKGRR